MPVTAISQFHDDVAQHVSKSKTRLLMFQLNFLDANHHSDRSKYFYSCIFLMRRQFLEVLTVSQFLSTVIQGKSVTCLEDLGSFFVKELKNSFVSRGIVWPKGMSCSSDA